VFVRLTGLVSRTFEAAGLGCRFLGRCGLALFDGAAHAFSTVLHLAGRSLRTVLRGTAQVFVRLTGLVSRTFEAVGLGCRFLGCCGLALFDGAAHAFSAVLHLAGRSLRTVLRGTAQFVRLTGLMSRTFEAIGLGCRFLGRSALAFLPRPGPMIPFVARERLAMAALLLGLVWGTALVWRPLIARIRATSELQGLLHAKQEDRFVPSFSNDRFFSGGEGVSSVAFSPDGRWIAAARGDNTTVWDAITFQEVQSWKDFPGVHGLVAFSRDGRLLASNDIFTLNIRELSTGKKICALVGPAHHSDHGEYHEDFHSAVFSPDGRWLAVTSDVEPVQTVSIWEISTGKLVRTLAPGFAGPMGSVVFSPDGRRLAAAGGFPSELSKVSSYDVIRIWDFSTGRESLSLVTRIVGITSLAFSPDGRSLATGSYEGAQVWDAVTGRELHTLASELRASTNQANSARSVAYSPDGRWIAVGNEDHIVRIWDAKTGEKLRDLEAHATPVRSVAFSPDGRRLASGSDGVRLWRLQ